jgi:O-antigen/teichoic acid export membrane protein
MASLLVALVPFAAAREGAGGRAALSDSLRRSTRFATLAIAAGTIAGVFVAGPFMTLWLGAAAPAVDDARRLLEGLLVALALQSIARPMVAIARAAGRPEPEAISTALAQPVALVAAAQASGLVPAALAYAAVTTVGVIALWWWLKVRLALDGLSWREVAALVAVSVGGIVGTAAARAAADALAIGPVATLLLVPAATLATIAALALTSGAITRDERDLLTRVALRR